jgi:hypothetical protein
VFDGRAPHHPDLNRAERSQRHRQRGGVDHVGFRPWTGRPALAHDQAAHGRQLDLACPLQHHQ